MDKSVLLLACLVCACQGRRVQIVGDEAPNSLQALAGLLQSFESPVSAGQANHRAHPANKGTAWNTPKLGRRALLGAGAATAGAALLAAQPASAAPKMSDGKWAKWSKADDGPFTEKFFEGFTETKTGLLYKVVDEGDIYGERPSEGQSVKASFVGFLMNGKQFDNVYKKNKPMEWRVGSGYMPKGMDEALLGMKPGEKRILKLSPNLAYGPKGAGDVIPSNSTLVYFVELVEALGQS
mmetsp:Transcript_160153/g.295173  ORF Transcript_160153/g.295173 Transcript_160153/m.295173 type:complete len:238 (+) Transcript_160153:85-798(+)